MAEILVVDDDRDTADTLADIIGMQGHEVRVVLDVEMPKLDGPGMAHAMLVEDLGRERIPVLIASGVVDLRTVAARVGTPYYVEKPVSLPVLISVLDRAIGEHRSPSRDRPSA